MFHEQLLKFAVVRKLFPARHLADGIDRTRFPGAIPGDLAVNLLTVVFLKFHVTPASAEVKVLKRESQRIHLLVAHRTSGILLMLFQEFAKRFTAVLALIRVQLRHLQRRRRRRIIEDMPQRPGATIDHPVVAHPGEHRLNARVTEHPATARVIAAQLHLAQCPALKFRIPVMPRERVVHHRPVALD